MSPTLPCSYGQLTDKENLNMSDRIHELGYHHENWSSLWLVSVQSGRIGDHL